MLATVSSAALNGIDAYPVEVEVNCRYGDTIIALVGLPDAAVKESKDRVMTALTNSGFKFPMGRTTARGCEEGRPQLRSANRTGYARRQRATRDGSTG